MVAVRLDKVKRPGGVFAFDMSLLDEDDLGVWLAYPTGAAWRAPHGTGTMPFDAVLLLVPGRPYVTWWVDDPDDPRVEVDVCLPPERTHDGWTYVDLELDPVRHERTGLVEVEDADELEEALARGWMPPADGALARATAADIAAALGARTEPWGDVGWERLRRGR